MLLLASGCDAGTESERRPPAVDGGITEGTVGARGAGLRGEQHTAADSRMGGTVLWEDLEGQVLESGYRLDDGYVIVEGDINLGLIEDVLARHEELRGRNKDKAFLTTQRHRRWDHTTIRWRFSGRERDDVPAEIRATVRAAIAAWEAVSDETGIRFRHTPDLDRRQHGIVFGQDDDDNDCHSQIGMQTRVTNVWLGSACGRIRSTVQHEIGHALGMLHEMTRRDRGEAFAINPALVTRDFVTQFRVDDHRSVPVGPVDVESIMIYPSYSSAVRTWNGIAGPLKFPASTSREFLHLWEFRPNPSAVGATHLVTEPTRVWNGSIRLGGSYAHLDQVRVIDVDQDRLDDLVIEFGEGLYFSRSGYDPWRPIAPGGVAVRAAIDEIVCGSLDQHPGADVLQIRGTEWTLWSSDGSSRTVSRTFETHDFEVNPADRTIFVIRADGRWALTAPRDPLGTLHLITTASMSTSDVQLVSFSPANLQAIKFEGGGFFCAPVDRSLTDRRWTPLFPGRTAGPRFRPILSGIDHAWFGFIDDDAEIDLLIGRSWSVSEYDPVEPLFISDVLANPTGTETPFTYPTSPGVSVDLARNVLVGRFNDFSRLSMIAYGSIDRRGLSGGRWIQRLDAQAIGVRYRASGPTRLADKHPLDYGAMHPDPQQPTEFPSVAAGSRFELRGVFTSPLGIKAIEVTVHRRTLPTGAQTMISREVRSFADRRRVAVVDAAFTMPASGRYVVTMTPIEPNAATIADRAVWVIGGSSRCGDAFVEDGEACDDGNLGSGDGCSPFCTWEVTCGDANRIDPEECDDGNVVDGDGCSASCTWESTCGDGVIGPGEACDDGNESNFDYCTNECEIQLE